MPRWLPIGLFALGGVMLAASVAGFLFGGGPSSSVDAAPTTTTTEVTATTSTSTSTTSTEPPATTVTTTAPTTTTSTATTTTTQPDETVEAFVTAFAAALASGDEAFVQARLHPQVVAGFGEDLCRAWVSREIMALSDYELISTDAGPQSRTVTFPTGSQTISDVFDATVSFTFQGQSFTDMTSYALVDHDMHWLGQCR